MRKDRDQKSALKKKKNKTAEDSGVSDIGHFVKHWITLKVPNFKTTGKGTTEEKKNYRKNEKLLCFCH